jgi:predicted dehydrogenase
MWEELKIGILGFGSAGQRYARVLSGMNDRNLEIYVFRRRNRRELISPNLKTSKLEDPVVHYGCRQIATLEEMTELELNLAIIASPNSLHFQDSISFINQSTPVIIEKPLGTQVSEIHSLLDVATKNNTFISVPFISRSHPIFEEIRRFMANIQINEIVSAKSWFLESVAEMHPYENPSESYIISSLFGGGALRALCHEFDLWHALVGDLKFTGNSNRKSYRKFEGDVETKVKIFCKSEKLTTALIEIDLDLVTSPKMRGGAIETASDTIRWDWVTGLVTIERNSRVVSSTYYNVSTDEIWSSYLNRILKFIDTKNSFEKHMVESSINIATLISDIERLVPIEPR